MLCVRCGRREATGLLIRALPEEAPPAPAPLDLPLEYVEPRKLESNVCDVCMSEIGTPGMRELLDKLTSDLETARAERIRALPNEPPSPDVVRLTDAVMRASTEAAVDLRELRDALAALTGFLASARGRTHANCALAAAQLDSAAAWRRLNRNPARWQYLPRAYGEILFDFPVVAFTFADPAFAHEFDATPEQLAAAVAALPADPPPNEATPPAEGMR